MGSSPAEVSQQDPATAAPRKRRRRTGGSGAGDDCFACRKRAAKCDRKRPYCSQCIEIGKECSGYKTTLTWGVGVASRGKLRGLSLPVASQEPASNSGTGQADLRRRKSSVSVKRDGGAVPKPVMPQLPLPSVPASYDQSRSLHQQPHTLPIPVPRSRFGWQMQTPTHERPLHLQLDTDALASPDSVAFSRSSNASLPSPFDTGGLSSLATAARSYAGTEYATPLEWPHQSPPPSHAFDLHEQYREPYQAAYSSPVELTGSSDSTNVHLDRFPGQGRGALLIRTGSYPSDQPIVETPCEFDTGSLIPGSFNDLQFNYDTMCDDEPINDHRSPVLANARFANPFCHLSSRMQALMDYYDRNVCPFLVAFDGPQNPYRKHVLNLALRNEGLQNALAALATNNMRMRAKTPKQIGFVEEMADVSGILEMPPDAGPTSEETMYKQMSIEQLNMQLTDPRAAHDDSVLATLLILCLFHVCDSGFSKFKTQLAGVQKLLSMRNASNRSGFEGWVEMFFTWFDVMTSTVNDREMQMRGESLDMLDLSANLGALEEFSGCDGILFKLIARLGRLNLLAQGRPVKRRRSDGAKVNSWQGQQSSSRPFNDRRTKSMVRSRASGPLTARDFENIDGNGWGTPIISSDEDAEGSADDETHKSNMDARQEFWREWRDIRSRLEAWEMNLASLPPGPNGASLDSAYIGPEHRDLMHINEAFRYSALLYTERLGQPMLPSSSQNFQDLVANALDHITALPITSCVNKFLLWPLFIAGTECVDEGHRNVIRARCIEVQRESGFYNNLSGLEVLERVWKEVGCNVTGGEAEEIKSRRRESQARQDGRYGQAFRWRNAMDRVDGEYILI
ncbi:hypothetical protein K431DRAFT_282267 [Polychaeton citri CBS 116435]|uniref:Zn(2)-C6 fungal-type domain-containing protein n=1 Tax=Polychaeton citri CBS 116435 TaxID=1314669 RepID=A0A9P4QE60_9PEZI|nr:hypothetical protein K431DRAFT_282267 [Polychaeton citri CBS 116435]